MAALALQLTTAGLAAVRAPAGTAKTVIAQLGLTAQPFVAAPTLTALPGEFKRLDITSGVAAAPTVAHITAYDTSADVWSALGFGLFLEDGTLFATYSAAVPVLSKAGVAFALMAFDIAFNADVLAEITFGDATFVWPPATENTRGIAALASQAEVNAGADATKIVTPSRLKVLLDAAIAGINTAIGAVRAITVTGAGLATGGGDLSANRTITVTEATDADVTAGTSAAAVVTPRRLAPVRTALQAGIDALKAITITGAGLATGGGALTANRTITVTEATAAEVTAGASASTVITPRRLGPITMLLAQNGFIRFFGFQMAWGRFSAAANTTTPVVFTQEFPSACFSALVSGVTNLGTGSQDNTPAVIVSSITKVGFSVFNADDEDDATCYIAVGY
jgi:hypothetical protein